MSVNRNPFAHLRCAALSDVGRKRKNNEDAAASFPSRGVWCVADGMGGGDDGEIASGAVVRAIDARLSEMPVPSDGDYSADAVVRSLAKAVDGASAWISDRAVKKKLDGCGSTLVGVAFDPTNPGTAVAFHVGDSRLYRIRGGDIRQITKDHSVEELMGVKDGRGLNPMFRGMILRAVGIERSVEIEITKFPVLEGDVVLLCSDGLSRMLEDRRIAGIVRESEGDMGAAAAKLVDAANAAGGVDNVTVVLVYVGPLPTASAAARLPDDGEGSSSGITESVFSGEKRAVGIVPFLRAYCWHIVSITLAALGGGVFAYFVATSPRREPTRSSPDAVQPVAPVAVKPREAKPAPAAEAATNVPPSLPPAASPAKPSVTAEVAKAESETAAVVFRRSQARPVEETQEDRERRQVLEQLKAERAHRALEDAVAEAREDERLAAARKLSECYFRDEFSAFAQSVNRLLGDGAADRLQTLGRALHLRRKDADVGVAAVEFMAETRSLAARIVAARGVKEGDAGMVEACRALVDADPASPASQLKFLEMLKLFSVRRGDGNGGSR